MTETATAIEPISTIVTICDHRSTRCPGENPGPDSGVYANQPISGPMLNSNPPNSDTPARKYSQYPKFISRGNETFRVPTISGTRYSPIPSITGTANKNIIA